MEAAEAKIQRILQRDQQFLVPHFQRPYSWREREWRVLWEDLLGLLGEDAPEPHFLGSIVTAPARTVPEGVEKRLLIDGQQRLTTIILLLAIIRARATAAGNTKLADRILDLILNRHEDGFDRYRLLPTQGETVADSDRDALIALIDGREHSSTSGIQEAHTYYSQKLARSDAPGLDALLKVITGKLTLVSIVLDEKDNPHRIFESLNGKGRPLSQADLIRNYFFMRLPHAEHEAVYRSLWQPMQRRLGEERLTEFSITSSTPQSCSAVITLLSPLVGTAPRPRYWFNIAVGRSGFWLSLVANVVHGKLGVKLMMGEEEAAAMALLQADRPAIEQEIGPALEWNPHPDKKFKAIRLTRPTRLSDHGSWPEAITWLTGTAVAFKRAFGPRIAALDV